MIELTCDKNQKLSKCLLNVKGMTFGKFNSLLKKKNIKVNGSKVNKDIELSCGDNVVVYGFNTAPQNTLPIVYQDQNVIIINKPQGIQVRKKDVQDNKFSVEDYFPYRVVHRLDRNTEGLLIMAKNEIAEKELLKAFKSHQISKFYKALVFGKPKNSEIVKAYLVKDEKRSFVTIYPHKVKNSVEIVTEYNLEKNYLGISLVNIKLHTGKTHQIRATMAYINHPIVADDKYQTKEYSEANNRLKKVFKKQCLCAYKLVFNLPENSRLKYLNDLNIEIVPTFCNSPYLADYQ